MPRIFANLMGGTITDAPLLIGATSVNSTAFAGLPVVAAPNTLAITLDPNGVNGAPEIVLVTAHTAAATVCTITRAQESTVARAHPVSSTWEHAVTKLDVDELPFRKMTTTGDILYASAANTASRLAGAPGVLRGATGAAPTWSTIAAADIATDAVTTAKIQDGQVTAPKLASDAVTTVKILDANVTAAKLATDAVTAVKIATDAVTTVKIQDDAVTAAKINTLIRHRRSRNALAIGTGGINLFGGSATGTQDESVGGITFTADATNGFFTVPSTGTYLMTLTVDPVTALNAASALNITANAITHQFPVVGGTAAAPATLSKYLVAGQTVAFSVTNNSGGALTADCVFEITKVTFE